MERRARTGGRLDCQILAALKAQQVERRGDVRPHHGPPVLFTLAKGKRNLMCCFERQPCGVLHRIQERFDPCRETLR